MARSAIFTNVMLLVFLGSCSKSNTDECASRPTQSPGIRVALDGDQALEFPHFNASNSDTVSLAKGQPAMLMVTNDQYTSIVYDGTSGVQFGDRLVPFNENFQFDPGTYKGELVWEYCQIRTPSLTLCGCRPEEMRAQLTMVVYDTATIRIDSIRLTDNQFCEPAYDEASGRIELFIEQSDFNRKALLTEFKSGVDVDYSFLSAYERTELVFAMTQSNTGVEQAYVFDQNSTADWSSGWHWNPELTCQIKVSR
jgi:hypothetical protein